MAGEREYLGDAVAHEAGADHGDARFARPLLSLSVISREAPESADAANPEPHTARVASAIPGSRATHAPEE